MRKNGTTGVAVIAIMLLAAGSLSADDVFKKTQFTLRAGYGLFQANGDNGDYTPGVNDFPVTPAYSVPVPGIGLAFFTSRSFAVGLNVGYALSGKVDLRDPSDGETVRADTPTSLLAVLSLCRFFPLSRQMELVVSVGGGGEYRMADETEYMSNAGSKIVIAAPEKPFSPLAAAGVGLQYWISSSLALAFECQGVYVFRDPAQVLLSPSLALVLKF